jgi:hypothetical protein
MSQHQPLTVQLLHRLAAVVDVAETGGPVTWETSTGRLTTAVARGITDHRGNHWFGDVRDGYLWMSGTWEHFVPMAEVLDMVARGVMSLDYRP